jgi:hypothetical protein
MTWQLKRLCHAQEKDGDWCIVALVNGNGRTPRGVEDGDGRARVQPSSSKGWFDVSKVGCSSHSRCLSLVHSLLVQCHV